jgi:dipeptidyl aminopeptidase/acylaminoacyl peptidase
MKIKLLLLLNFCFFAGFAQTSKLTVEHIMRDPKWLGTSPSDINWSESNDNIYFSWNPDKNKGDSTYMYSLNSKKTEKLTGKEVYELPAFYGAYSLDNALKVYTKSGDLYLYYVATGTQKRLSNTTARKSNAKFSADGQRIIYQEGSDIFSVNLNGGEIKQHTQFDAGKKTEPKKKNEEEDWLEKDQLAMFEVLAERKEKKELAKKSAYKPKEPKKIYLDGGSLRDLEISPRLDFVAYTVFEAPKNAKRAIVPSYVTESGYTEDLNARTKVGSPNGSSISYVYNVAADTVFKVNLSKLEGIFDEPDYLKDYPKKDSTAKKKPRVVSMTTFLWSPLGSSLLGIVRADDNKDRWIVKVDPKTGAVETLDRQRDEAWVAGPGIGYGRFGLTFGWISESEVYFQSEASGYSHLYKMNITTKEKTALTSGKFEVIKAELSKDKSTFFLTTNEVHPGEQHFYHMSVNGGKRTQITSKVGAHDVSVSPDEKYLAIRYSNSNTPWELYLQENKAGAEMQKLTTSTTAEFNAYAWRAPEVISFKARDGQEVFSRIYVPKKKNNKAVVFVHGAGYLQNAHKWWSNYYREYMFHNLLCDFGYTVLDVDYRGSAGYGRDVRTGIYRHMGGKDLTDHVDAADLLVKKYGIDKNKIGVYGGSYGGFITLMALFTTPDVFKAGAALRPVTDWAAYNHGYTANILNEPFTDSLAYRRSSPIYFADGLKNNLLICHGMVDVNVHYQDAVRLAQRLIELKKENWELASYPMEDHGFVEPSSWTDEYKRILKLFEEKLK